MNRRYPLHRKTFLPLRSQKLSLVLQNLVLLVYVALLFLVVPRHEAWGDEQTAWVLARGNSLWHLATTILRQEGTPGLWHGLLWVMAALHLSFAAAYVLSGAAAIAGVYVLLRYSPFPLWIRCLLPFTFYIVYQYAVVARQYVLFPVLVFSMAALASSKRWRPYWFAVVASLLANLSLHGFCFAVGLVIAICVLRGRLPSAGSFHAAGKRNIQAAGLLGVALLVAIATALPLHVAKIQGLSSVKSKTKLLADLPQDLPLQYEAPAGMNHLQTIFWQKEIRHRDSAAPRTLLETIPHAAMVRAVALLSLLAYPISTSNLLAFAFLLLLFYWLRVQRALVLSLPYLLIVCACLLTQVYEHHTGMLFITLIAIWWIALNLDPSELPAKRKAVVLQRSLSAVFLVVIAFQVWWGLHAIVSDIRQPYAGDDALTHYLEPIYRQKTVATGMYNGAWNVPLFSHRFESKAFIAMEHGMPIHPSASQALQLLMAKLALRPSIVVESEMLVGDQSLKNQITPTSRVGVSELSLASIRLIQDAGYHETHRFCGYSFMRDGYSRELCDIVYEPFPVGR